MECVSVSKCITGELIKVYNYDQYDYKIVISGNVKFTELFCSKCGGIDRAINRAQELNKLTISEKVF